MDGVFLASIADPWLRGQQFKPRQHLINRRRTHYLSFGVLHKNQWPQLFTESFTSEVLTG